MNHLPHPAQRAVTLDGAPGAAGPDLQEAGGAGRLGGTGPHSDPQVFSLLQLRVEKAALRLNAVPGAEIINWPVSPMDVYSYETYGGGGMFV